MNIQSTVSKLYGGIPLAPRPRFFVVFALILIGAFVIIQPIKNHAWNVIKNQGDDALAARHFVQARVEYTKLRLIRATSHKPQELIKVVDATEHNIVSLRPFYASRNDTAMLKLIDQATATYPAPDTATAACQELLKENEASLAEACIDKTTATWPEYREGWLTARVIARVTGNGELKTTAEHKAIELDPTVTLP